MALEKSECQVILFALTNALTEVQLDQENHRESEK